MKVKDLLCRENNGNKWWGQKTCIMASLLLKFDTWKKCVYVYITIYSEGCVLVNVWYF